MCVCVCIYIACMCVELLVFMLQSGNVDRDFFSAYVAATSHIYFISDDSTVTAITISASGPAVYTVMVLSQLLLPFSRWRCDFFCCCCCDSGYRHCN